MATTKYIINSSVIPLTTGENYLYFADASYLETLDVVCKFTNQNALYIGFVFSNSSLSTAGLTEVYNGSWINENYRTIYVEDNVSPFILPNADRPLTCFIFKTLKNCSLTNPATTIQEGQLYTSGVTTEMLSTPTVSILMGGIDITSTAWDSSTKTITINNVSGNIDINIEYSGLPAEYIELEYIQSTGTQYIDTGVLLNYTSGVKVTADLIGDTHNDCILFGCFEQNFCLGIYFLKSPLNVYYWAVSAFGNDASADATYNHSGPIQSQIISQPSPTTFCVNHNNNQLYTWNADGGYSGTASMHSLTGSSSTTATLLAYKWDNTGSIWGYLTAKVYGAEITNNTQIVRRLIPVRKVSTGEVGMYDYVSNTFFGNAGTGEFIAGPVKDLPNAYQEVEYLQSTGDQWFEVNYKHNSSSLYKTIAMCTSNAKQWQMIAGSRTSIASADDINFGFNYGNYLQYNMPGKTNNTLHATTLNTKYILNISNFTYIVNSTTYATNANTCTQATANDYIFWNNWTGSPSAIERLIGRIYSYFNISENNINKILCIPCYRKSDNKPGLYDLVTNQFYINQGTGADFTVGPDVN